MICPFDKRDEAKVAEKEKKILQLSGSKACLTGQ